jgi:(2R)-ethylmalonyl-CoA mutase
VVYDGIRTSADELVSAAVQEDVHLVGLSILSGAHLELVPPLVERLRVPVVVGGIIPDADADALRAKGVAAVYTPRDYDLVRVIGEMVDAAARAAGLD